MGSLISVVLWVLPSVSVGVAVGYYLGRGPHRNKDADAAQQERAVTLKALTQLLQSTERLTTDVDSHNTELQQVERTVGDLKVSGELEQVQHALLGQISTVLESNQRLEDDLVCARYRLEEQAQELDRTRVEARTDALSGVANRKAFDETLQFLLLDHKREGACFALVLADVDHFKWINDTHGHPAGDRVVTQVGAFLDECVRGHDHVCRYGGDEFALLLLNLDAATAIRVGQRIRSAVERRNFDIGVKGERVSVTFSMGLAVVRAGDTAETLLARADEALYRSKHAGRNQLQSSVTAQELATEKPADDATPLTAAAG